MGRLIRFFFQLLLLAVAVVILTGVWIVFDGLHDTISTADVALITCRAPTAGGISQPDLDRVLQLYNQGAFRHVIISGSKLRSGRADPAATAKYLEQNGLSFDNVIVDTNGDSTLDTARATARIMKTRGFDAIMIVGDYYRMTRMKLALRHENVVDIQNAHVGSFQKEDVMNIGREIFALYEYIGKYYLLPGAEKIKEEAAVGADKAKVEAEKAKDSVDKKLDNMPK
jgi:uncharacterized SAM-binding protein YcdF (DUF218 family)